LKTFLYIFGYLLQTGLEIWRFFLNFGGIKAIQNLKKQMILPLLLFNIAFKVYNIASKKKHGWCRIKEKKMPHKFNLLIQKGSNLEASFCSNCQGSQTNTRMVTLMCVSCCLLVS
jgi:hypothetical protein